MYPRKELDANSDRLDSGGKKRYELSLRRGKNVILPSKNQNKEEKEKPMGLKKCNESGNSSDSQNFMLRLSDSFIADETQENREPEVRKFAEEEIILISDSSEDETSLGYDRATSREFGSTENLGKNLENSNVICTIISSDSDDPGKEENSPRAERKCSIMYTSDDTASETESGIFENKENFVKIRSKIADNVIPESDESIFSFEKMRGVLPDNDFYENEKKTAGILRVRNVIGEHRKTPENPMNRPENRRIEDYRATPQFSDVMKNDSRKTPEIGKIDNEISKFRRFEDSRKILEFGKAGKIDNEIEKIRRIEDSRKTPEIVKTGKIDNEIFKSRRIEDTRETPKSGKTGKIDNEISRFRRIEDSRQTPEFGKTGKIDNEISRFRRIEDSRQTPEFGKTGKIDNEISKFRKIEDSRQTPEFGKIGKIDNEIPRFRRTEDSRQTPEFGKAGKIDNEISKFLRTEDSQQTPEFGKVGKVDNEISKLRRIEDSRQTPESGKAGKIDNEISKFLRTEDSRQTPEFVKSVNIGNLSNPGRGSERNELTKTPGSAKITSRTTVLTNKDVRNILKVIKSKRAVVDWRPERKERSVSDDSEEEVEESMVDSQENKKNVAPVIIPETDSESENSGLRDSEIDYGRPIKTHLTRFLDPSGGCDSPETMSKKLEVAHWLMTNSADTRRSESSISNVSPSCPNTSSSGNSSLERLETNYETPNNRDKIRNRTTNTDDRSKIRNSAKSVRQTTIDNYLRQDDNGKGKIYTPVTPRREKKIDEKNDIAIEDCADILDKLYGNEWRAKANDILPASEPRKKLVTLRDKGVQTERKGNSRGRRATKSSDSNEEFESFVKNMKPNLNSTKKPVSKSDYRRCGFINDSSSSAESCGESTYLTALTTPLVTNNQKIRPAPVSEYVQRAIAICDSESEDDNNVDNRKVLEFSDDEDDVESSSTSEYDPNDVIPPKKKSTKTVPGPKTSTKTVTKNGKTTAHAPNISKSKSSFLSSLSADVPLNEAHPEAKKYRQDYKNTKEELCKYLYKLYNEKIFDEKLPNDMTIEWNVRMRGTAGFCYNKKSVKALGGVTRSSRIVLATKILDTPDRLRDTLVHEMCHAAAWLINEVADGHGPFWRGWVSKAMKAFPELPAIKRCHDYKITTKFTYRCTGCGYSVGRHSKSLDIERKRCGHCYGKFELLINKVTKSGTVEVRTPTTKKPSAFALFVKENYSSVKKDRKGVAHKEVMQILGQQFSAIKITKKNENNDENSPIVL